MNKKFFKRLGIIFLILVVVTLVLSAILASIFEDRIGNMIISEANKQLKSELIVKDFDLSVISSFPSVAANLRGVELLDNNDGVLLEAEKISFRLGLFSMFGDIKVKSVLVSDGAMTVHIDKRSNANYDILKESSTEEEGEAGSTGIKLGTAVLKQMEVIYSDEKAKQEVMVEIEDATFSGNFSSKKFSLDSDASIKCRFIELNGERFFAGKDLAYDANVLVNFEEGIYDFKDVEVAVESNVFKIDGQITETDGVSNFDLTFVNEAGNLGSIMQLLPEDYFKDYGNIVTKGDFVLSGTIEGESTAQKSPRINASLQLDNGRVTGPSLGGAIKDVSLLATFDNGKKQDNSTSIIEIKRLKGYFNRELAELKLKVRNLNDPYIDFWMDGVLPLDIVYGLFGNPKITGGDGEIEIKGLELKGRYKDMLRTSRISRVETKGELEFDDASLTINGEKMILDRGRLKLDGNTLHVEDLKLEGAGSDLQFNGNAFNLVPVLFADSLNTKGAELEFQADLHAKSLDLDRLEQIADISGEEVATSEVDSLKVEQVQKREQITNFLKGTFDAVIDEFNYNKIEGTEFNGKLRFNNNELDINGQTNAMEGAFDLKGKMLFEEKPRLEAKLECENIAVKEFFRQTENFGQEVLQSRHLDGTLNAKIAIFAYWDESGNFLEDKLRVLAGLGIEDGKLANFEMLEDFSSYVNVKDLRQIQFVNMQNFFEVRKRRLYIPAMFIQSNALNLTVSGEHSFDQEIKYYLKVNAGQVMFNRLKAHDPHLTPQKAKRKGWFNLYYSILGTIDDYHYKSAKKEVKFDFENSDRRRKDIQYELEQIFGIVEFVQEPVEWEDIPEYDEAPGDEEYIEWDDEEGDDEEYIHWDDGGEG